MSGYDGNYGEHDERDLWEWRAYERDMEAEERDHEVEEAVDRLRRDWPVKTKRPPA